MMKLSTRMSRSTWLVLAALPLLGFSCAGTQNADTDTDGDKETSTTKDNSEDTDTDKDTSEDTSTDETEDPKAVGAPCEKDGECKSEMCREFSVVLPDGSVNSGKTCAECKDHSACTDEDEGLACVPTVILSSSPTVAHKCSDGAKGNECEEQEHCKDGLYCAQREVNGEKVEIKNCSECRNDDDCKDEEKPSCKPAPLLQGGYLRCVAETADGKLPDGESCMLGGEDPDEQCSNYCDSFSAGPLEQGYCVICKEDSHCEGDKVCQKGSLGLDGTSIVLTPSECVDAS